MRSAAALMIGLALVLSSCGESEPVPPAQRVSADDIWKAAVARLAPKPKLAPKLEPAEIIPLPASDPRPVPAHDRRSEPPVAAEPVQPPAAVAASPAKQAAAAKAVKLKNTKQWERKKARNGAVGVPGVSVAGHPCWELRLLGSPEAVMAEARKRSKRRAVPATYRRLIYACFPKTKG